MEAEKKSRRSSSQSYDISSQDQVVPQYKNGRGDKDSEDHRNFPLTQAPAK